MSSPQGTDLSWPNDFSWQEIAGDSSDQSSEEQVKKRQDFLLKNNDLKQFSELFEHNLPSTVNHKNCENLIGSVEIPLGVAGPIELQISNWHDRVLIPLATTEGALVASVNRGSKVLRQAGITQVVVENRGMTRSPVFECASGVAAVEFCRWFEEHIPQVRQIAESTSSHLKLISHQSWIRGRYVFVRFAFNTDQAMGMNMVTIALQKALSEALERHPEIKLVSLSSNVCTDKKDSVINSLYGRGYWVQAEATIPASVVSEILGSSIEKIIQVHTQKNYIGSNLAGSFSQNAHVANVLSAMFLATGQDPAHVVEGSKAFLQLEAAGSDHQDLYAVLTLPNINVGVIGGGTGLPQQRQARRLISKADLTAEQLAGVMGAAALAGEISLLAALAEDQLAFAHAKLGRTNNI